jgi:hypothetical protein
MENIIGHFSTDLALNLQSMATHIADGDVTTWNEAGEEHHVEEERPPIWPASQEVDDVVALDGAHKNR